MSHETELTVGIIGAGSMGVLAGFDLARAGVSVAFLVRPHRLAQLARPQVLYSYDDDSLHHYDDFEVLTTPQVLAARRPGIIIVTLDGASLRSGPGLQLVTTLGTLFAGTRTGIVLGAPGPDERAWFVDHSGIPAEQVAMGTTGALVHEVGTPSLPIAKQADSQSVRRADYAFRRMTSDAFTVEDTVPAISEVLSAIRLDGAATFTGTIPSGQLAIDAAMLAPILAWGLLGWSPLDELDPDDPTWQLGVESMREIQSLPLHGDAGRAAADEMNSVRLLAAFQRMSDRARPLDFAAFNAYHHGGKVNDQDRALLRRSKSIAEESGVVVPALDALLQALGEQPT